MTRRSLVLCGIALVLAAGCGQATPPPVAPTAVPSTSVPQPAAPTAVLKIDAGGIVPAMGVAGFSPLVFDASMSTGDGLSYLLELSDGTNSRESITSHVSAADGSGVAKLTVTDRLGRSDTVTASYFVARLDNNACCGTFWYYFAEGGGQIKIRLAQHDGTLTGVYQENGVTGRQEPLTGMLSDRRTITLRSQEGDIELAGAVAWASGGGGAQMQVVLRLAVRGGIAGGATREFKYSNPF